MPCSKESALDLLLAAHRANRLGHAHLLSGVAGSGKAWLARHLAAEVLGCSTEALLAHPDAHFVQPESKSRRILADQIRELDITLHRKPLLTPAKVAILTDADRLQPAAANAFLKTLEEPPEGSLLILTTSLKEAVLETILSRCMETSLHGGQTVLTDEAGILMHELARSLLVPGGATVASAFRLTRAVQAQLAEIRERIAAEYAAVFKQESARYRNATNAGDWLDDREAQLKAIAESAALREREQLLAAVMVALGGALRVAVGGDAPHPVCTDLAAAFTPAQLFDKVEAFETMRRRLALTVNEPLCLEVGFLEIALGRRNHP
jgi:DNA polymerase-3 subunit delta'